MRHCRIRRAGTSCVICVLCVLSMALAREVALAAGTFSFEAVVEQARVSGSKPYLPPASVDPVFLNMRHADWNDIRFKAADSLWREDRLPLEVQFFFPGFMFKESVRINTVEDGVSEPLQLSRDMFDYGRNKDLYAVLPENFDAAGFRLHGPVHNSGYYDEFLVFLGASYFRGVAAEQHYGMSVRGLAIDTALPKAEEFPFFREFWIVKPAAGEKETTVYALLDSKSVCGAYAFVITPGTTMVAAIKAHLFFRERPKKVGLAPMTSMFLYGENTLPCGPQDWRPEVHDSDGLLMHTGHGEWIWRALQNPHQLMISQFGDTSPKGFGLIQRDQDFNNYQDLGADMERRPSVWIEPGEDWGPGHVELYLRPSMLETDDNVACYWVPKNSAEPGSSLSYSYKIYWHNAPDDRPKGGAHVVSTRNYRGQGRGGTDLDTKTHVMVVDFEDGPLQDLAEDAEIASDIWVGDGGKLLEAQTVRNDQTGGWRLSFKVELDKPTIEGRNPPKPGMPVEMRAFLRHGKDILSETWSYAIEP